ncbi:MAG: divalent-cation tolerance protein CutA [Gammaproteobacteria bacterium]|nr:divalent-cation tolerance protein CutA [Gammaproteobacteria bacterium]
MPNKPKFLLVLSTCPGSITAKKIANDLVADQLAACVQIIPGVQSFFRWVGKVDNKEEHLLLIKTTADRYQAVQDRIQALHPYELPEVVAVPVSDGLAGYLAWIKSCTEPSGN